jgi:hypothetical protein
MFGAPQKPDYWRAANDLGFGLLTLLLPTRPLDESLRLRRTSGSLSRLEPAGNGRQYRLCSNRSQRQDRQCAPAHRCPASAAKPRRAPRRQTAVGKLRRQHVIKDVEPFRPGERRRHPVRQLCQSRPTEIIEARRLLRAGTPLPQAAHLAGVDHSHTPAQPALEGLRHNALTGRTHPDDPAAIAQDARQAPPAGTGDHHTAATRHASIRLEFKTLVLGSVFRPGARSLPTVSRGSRKVVLR